MNFNFGEVLTRAWQIVWKHKVLWIFGILASCGRGGGGGNGGGGNSGFETQGPGPDIDIPPQLERFVEWVGNNVATFIVLIVTLTCVIALISIFLGTIGRIGLIRGTAEAEGGSDNLIFGQLFSESTPYFWRVFGLTLIASLPSLVLVLAAITAVVVFTLAWIEGDSSNVGLAFAGMLPILIGCICLLIPVGWVISLIVHQSERSIVLEDSPVLPSLSRGWNIFRNNLGPIIVMAIILAVITLVVGFVIAIPILIVVVPTFMAFAAGNGENWNPLLLALICVCLYIPVSWLLNGVAIAYAESAWTLTYMRLTRKPDSNDIVTPPSEPLPPSDDSDRTIISSSNA